MYMYGFVIIECSNQSSYLLTYLLTHLIIYLFNDGPFTAVFLWFNYSPSKCHRSTFEIIYKYENNYKNDGLSPKRTRMKSSLTFWNGFDR